MMRTTIVAILGLVAISSAVPAKMANLAERQTTVCTSGNAQCCAVDVLGIADLDCSNPTAVPTNGTDFQALCAAEGLEARCCTLDLLDQALLCETPIGVDE